MERDVRALRRLLRLLWFPPACRSCPYHSLVSFVTLDLLMGQEQR